MTEPITPTPPTGNALRTAEQDREVARTMVIDVLVRKPGQSIHSAPYVCRDDSDTKVVRWRCGACMRGTVTPAVGAECSNRVRCGARVTRVVYDSSPFANIGRSTSRR